MQIVGLETNVNFLLDLCRHKSFQEGDVHTAFIRDHEKSLFSEEKLDDANLVQAALASVCFNFNLILFIITFLEYFNLLIYIL